MNNRIFLNMFEQMNPSEEAVKQLHARINSRNKEKKRKIMYAYTAVACTVVAVSVLFGIAFFNADNTILPNNSGIPSWYEPQKLSVTTLTYRSTDIVKNTQSSNASKTAFMKSAKPFTNTAETKTPITINTENIIIDSTPVISDEPQYRSQDFYIDPQTNHAYILQDYIASKMKLTSDFGLWINTFKRDAGFVIYTTYDALTQSEDYTDYLNVYWMDLDTGSYKELPIITNGKYPRVQATSDNKYLLVEDYSAQPFYLVNMEDMSKRVITNSNSGYYTLSPHDKFVIYYDNKSSLHFYNVQTGKDSNTGLNLTFGIDDPKYKENIPFPFRQFMISAVGFFDDDNYYVGEVFTANEDTQEGFVVFDTNTGKQVDPSIIENSSARYALGTDMLYNNIIARVDLMTGEIVKLSEFSDAYITSKNNDYLYTYNMNDDFIDCIDIATQKSFKININKSFKSQIDEMAKNFEVNVQLQISDDNTQLFLSYTLTQKPNQVSS